MIFEPSMNCSTDSPTHNKYSHFSNVVFRWHLYVVRWFNRCSVIICFASQVTLGSCTIFSAQSAFYTDLNTPTCTLLYPYSIRLGE